MSQMKTVRTSELIGAALDWAVAKAEGLEIELPGSDVVWAKYAGAYSPSVTWSHVGPLIHKHAVALEPADKYAEYGNNWKAEMVGHDSDLYVEAGPTPLIAACRAIVAANLGDEVKIPAELLP